MSTRGAYQDQPAETSLRMWVRVGMLIVFALLAGVMFSLDINSNRIVSFLFVLFVAAAAYELVALLLQTSRTWWGGSVGEVHMLISFIRVLAIVAIGVGLVYSTGRLKEVGAVFGAFAGMLLGFSLQAPVSGFAAWALVTIKRPFRVGDRVLFPTLGLLGDVLDVGFMYTKLNQVGGAIGSEDAIGRYILIPNAMLFSQVAINYTPQQAAPYFLDELVVRLTYDSDWDMAEKILMDAAREVTADIIRDTGKEPYIRSDIYDYGVYMRLRYMTLATDRPRVTHEILRLIFRDFQNTKKVDFAIPYVYSYRKGMEVSARGPGGGSGQEPVTEVGLDNIEDPEALIPLTKAEEKELEDLANRIQQMGLLQPIVVQRSENGRCLLLAGRFRLLACRRLGWRVIPAIVKEADGLRNLPEGAPPTP